MDNNTKFFTDEILGKLVADIGVAFWVFDMLEDKLYYNDAFYQMLGKENHTEFISMEEWGDMIHPQDREYALTKANDFLGQRSKEYSIECRMLKDDGDVVWIQDTGKHTKYDENGVLVQISGITQNITEKKMNEEKLNLAMKFAGFSVWEWDVTNDSIVYDNDYSTNLGYTPQEWGCSMQDIGKFIHPDDLHRIQNDIDNNITSIGSSYNNKLRIRKKNNEYMWVHDVGEVFQVDVDGKPSRVIGGRIDIDELETSKIELLDYKESLELKIQSRTQELLKRDTILLELNQMFRKLMSTPTGADFNKIVYKYLEEFSSIQNNSRITIFRAKEVNGKTLCYLDNTPKTPYHDDYTIENARASLNDFSVERLSNGAFTEEQREEYYVKLLEDVQKIDLSNMNVFDDLLTFADCIKENKVLNIRSVDFKTNEILFTQLQGIKALLMSPIILNNEFWGYLVVDNCEDDTLFTKEEEEIFEIVGAVLAQAIQKNEAELLAIEAIEHNKVMLNAMPLCCNLWLDGKNISSNDEAVRLFELKDQQEYLDRFLELSPEYQPCGNKTADLVGGMLQAAEEKGWHRFEWMHCKLNGELIPCEITLVKVDYRGSFLIAGYTRDLREFKSLLKDIENHQKLIEQAHGEALSSSKAKTNFLANMSHEIRTPMNAISGMTDIILRESTDNEVSEYAANIKRASENLLAIINDVLDISKIESGKLDVVEGEYNLSDALSDVLAITNNRLDHKPLMFNTNFQNDLPDNLIGDDIRVKQIMVNLINNAIKFTNEGHIDFVVQGEFAGGVLKLKFSISDTGIGISKEDLGKLFIEFERVNTTKNRSVEGTGLGLAISKRLCEMMDGEIEVESELGKGTKFTATIIQKYETYTPIAKVKESKSILVYESREIYRESTRLACQQLELKDVVFCSQQSEFSDALQEKLFDYIFTSSIHHSKVQKVLKEEKIDCKVVLLADNDSVKARYNSAVIVIPTNSVAIANVLNGKISINNNKIVINFIAPDATILVVDDNLVNLKVAQGLMRPYKFSIETAENGQEAVDKIMENSYDLVFMDHMMPVMDGIDATIAIRKLEGEYFQKLPIVALTANAIVGTKEMFLNEGMNDFIAKPIQLKTLNDVLAKWIPSDKQIMVGESETQEDVVKEIEIEGVDTKLGVVRVGGDFDTYIDILSMYYKDGIKRIKIIQEHYYSKEIINYKIEVHALKSASASIGALDISEGARLLEDAATKENWNYINQNTVEFISNFTKMLENINTALKTIVVETDSSTKEMGNDDEYISLLKGLSEALDNIDVNKCDILLDRIFSFNWSEERLVKLEEIKDFVDGYEYDEAVERIEEIIN